MHRESLKGMSEKKQIVRKKANQGGNKEIMRNGKSLFMVGKNENILKNYTEEPKRNR